VQEISKEKGEGGWASDRAQKTKAQDKIPSESLLGKMSKYWDNSPILKGKRNKMVKYCCFI
jgi:hypothetical protein